MSVPPVNNSNSVQCDVQCDVQHDHDWSKKTHYFLDESRRGRRNPAYDEPIPYSLAVPGHFVDDAQGIDS
jgi:hypothetical protein